MRWFSLTNTASDLIFSFMKVKQHHFFFNENKNGPLLRNHNYGAVDNQVTEYSNCSEQRICPSEGKCLTFKRGTNYIMLYDL
jgi:hypothetical protein